LQGKTIKQYALERLFPGDIEADKAWQALKMMVETRVEEGLSGKVSNKTVRQILDDELIEDRS